MGAGGSTPEAFFAFQVVQLEYSLLTSTSASTSASTSTSTQSLSLAQSLSPEELQSHLQALYTSALTEYSYESLLLCNEPSCILIKLKNFDTPEEAKKYCRVAVSESLAAREKSKPKVVEADYSKGFSGSAADTKAEKDFEKMMRDGGEEEEDGFPLLKPPNIRFPEQKEALLNAGSWCRELTASGCYMYCHTLTRNIVSLRPDDYEDEEVAEIGSDAGEKVIKDPANGLQSCLITDLPKTLDDLIANGETKTPLILDGTTDSQCLAFYSMKASLEDVSSLVVPYSVSGVKRSDVIEKCRSRLVGAIKSGSTFVLYMGAVNIEHADFKKKLCKKDSFPVEVFQQRGEKLLGPKSKPRFKLILREDDMEEGVGDVFARDGFQVLVVSTMTPFEYEEKLKDCIPLGYMLPIYVHN